MPVTPLQLIAPQQITTVATTYYTSTNIKTRIDAFTATNTSAGPVTLTVYLVPSGGSAGNSTMVTDALSLPAGYTWNGLGIVGQMLAGNGTIQAAASGNTSVTIIATGTQISP